MTVRINEGGWPQTRARACLIVPSLTVLPFTFARPFLTAQIVRRLECFYLFLQSNNNILKGVVMSNSRDHIRLIKQLASGLLMQTE